VVPLPVSEKCDTGTHKALNKNNLLPQIRTPERVNEDQPTSTPNLVPVQYRYDNFSKVLNTGTGISSKKPAGTAQIPKCVFVI